MTALFANGTFNTAAIMKLAHATISGEVPAFIVKRDGYRAALSMQLRKVWNAARTEKEAFEADVARVAYQNETASLPIKTQEQMNALVMGAMQIETKRLATPSELDRARELHSKAQAIRTKALAA